MSEQIVRELSKNLAPEDKAKIEIKPKQKWTPPQLRSFKLNYKVGELVLNTDLKIKKLEVPEQTDIFEKNRLTGNKVKNRSIDKSTGQLLPYGYGFKKFDEITKLSVNKSDIQKVQLKPDASKPSGFQEVEVADFTKTDLAEITDSEILPRTVVNDWLIEKEYEIYGTGADLYKLAKSLVERKAVAGIKEFVLVEGENAYKGFIVPPPILVEDKFYLILKLARRKRENLIKAYHSSTDTAGIVKEKKQKKGVKMEVPLDDF